MVFSIIKSMLCCADHRKLDSAGTFHGPLTSKCTYGETQLYKGLLVVKQNKAFRRNNPDQ